MDNTTPAEKAFLTTLENVQSLTQGYSVLFLRFSALREENRAVDKVRRVCGQYRQMLEAYSPQFFEFSNQNVAIVAKKVRPSVFESMMTYLINTYPNDREIYNTKTPVFKVYNLDTEFNKIYKIAQDIAQEWEKKQASIARKQDVPLAPEHLDNILINIKGFNILRLIRRQEALRISPSGFEGVFFEYFTSMGDLKKAIAPDVNVLSNQWLFQYLSRTLDIRMLSIFSDIFAHTKKAISLNLNIETLFTKEFEEFLENMPEGIKFVAEVQMADIMQNPQNYMEAKDLLHEAGHQILIDSLPPVAFNYLNLNTYDPDLIKLLWPFKGMSDGEMAQLQEAIEPIDKSKIILMRVENETSLGWGLMNGIDKFQGYMIDNLSNTICQKKCTIKCPKKDCADRKGRIWGKIRDACKNQSRLDAPFETNIKRS